MTTPPAELACLHLATLWPAPAAFAALDPHGGLLAGDRALGARAAELLGQRPAGTSVVRDGATTVVADGSGCAFAADVPRAALPGLLESDLRGLLGDAC